MSVPLLLYLMIYICKYDCMQSYSYVGGEEDILVIEFRLFLGVYQDFQMV
ncbi:hypothetical protein IEC_04081 [Bacillus toyonensis]|nr:hypothetical protein IE3_00649 [Bacillus cereus BAG3X2-1]EJQ35461.1 hypothetical protein IEC_04081 [Bacillus toyonensis]EJR57692.1 hypothetical protein IIO_04702 [Bacillus cereus VD115]EJS60581.1 hypothetical protein ICG_00648 [Bacillus cereus BAG1X1-3]EOO70968.1 hypothetical protein IC7_04227 [Bacillus cereus BAG1O-1]EOP48369.1 hypothetical protein IKQ_04483 [Bacillus cereus VDM053]SEA95450.1 hypothetical protein SAMN04488146_104637 [Bacillus nitratireducens]GCF74891.1 hypothetical prote